MYDERLDECVVSETVPGSAGTDLEISVRRYNGGEPKVQITRFIKKGEDVIRVKLGRITFDEISHLLPAIEQLTAKARMLLAASNRRNVQLGLYEEA